MKEKLDKILKNIGAVDYEDLPTLSKLELIEKITSTNEHETFTYKGVPVKLTQEGENRIDLRVGSWYVCGLRELNGDLILYSGLPTPDFELDDEQCIKVDRE